VITKDQIARAYALMECERAPNRTDYGYNPAKNNADFFLKKNLIAEWEWMKFLNNEYPHSDNGPFREAFMDMFAMYEHENPLPPNHHYAIEFKHCYPVASKNGGDGNETS